MRFNTLLWKSARQESDGHRFKRGYSWAALSAY